MSLFLIMKLIARPVRLGNVAVSFESGAARSTLAVALAACLSSSRMKLRAATLLPSPPLLSFDADAGASRGWLRLSAWDGTSCSRLGAPETTSARLGVC